MARHQRVINPADAILEALGKINKAHTEVDPEHLHGKLSTIAVFLAVPICQPVRNIWSIIDCQKLLKKKQGKQCQKLPGERRRLWLAKLNQDL